ncbi:hypothetical protein CRD60_00885 [Bifidobacterium aemilianum]|uniref:Uncharacterized protein n=1 Tax=Bifidobacterium aemilianum TaxID=2493120 RepID=A0A366KB33_9BIFI|nr:hypothetical protein [Bifidobacterium aemilianum]RBP98452.1 hypothetical protein CRD60_00885 [Bifidobacterium aemilianum]
MSCELVTGFSGKPHVSATQIGAQNVGAIGGDRYVLSGVGDELSGTMSSANTFVLGAGGLMFNGRYVHCESPTQVTITSGGQGVKRNDLIVCRYEKASDGRESARIIAIKGTPTSGTPADPAHHDSPIWSGVSVSDMPLYRIPIDGISVGTPVPIFRVLRNASYVQDQVSTMPRQRFGTMVVNVPAGSRQGVQLASPARIQDLFGHGWQDTHMTGYAMCSSGDQLDVISCDYNGGFNARFNAHTGGLHRINWCITDWSDRPYA